MTEPEMTEPGAEQVNEPVGDLGAEATRLFAAAQQWWRDAHDAGSGSAETGPPHTGPECTLCPVCQLLALARHVRPEVFEHLSSAATSFVHAVKATFDGHDHGGGSGTADAPTVERIDIR